MHLIRSVSLDVVAISVDNAATNRKFYTDMLCGGQLKINIFDEVSNQPIYLLFDPVHTLKNIYNNFQKKRLFKCPAFGPNLQNGCVANFEHIVDLHYMESSMPLRKAHKLTSTVL